MMTEHVTTFAARYREPQDHVYLLVDALGECSEAHPLSIPSLVRDLGEDAIVRVLRPDLAHTPAACPALIQLAAPGAEPAKRLLALSAIYAEEDLGYSKRYVCGWLLSSASPEVVAQRIAELCRITSSGASKGTTPWFEPVRLELLAAALGPQVGAMFAPIKAWLFLTSWGGFSVLHRTSTIAQDDKADLVRHTQHAAQLVNEVLGAWRLAQRQVLSFAPWKWNGAGLLPPQAAVHAFRLVRDAERLGLRRREDIITLSLHRVCIHPLLPEHVEIQRDIFEAADGKASLESRFENYDDAIWQRIVAALPRAENYS